MFSTGTGEQNFPLKKEKSGAKREYQFEGGGDADALRQGTRGKTYKAPAGVGRRKHPD